MTEMSGKLLLKIIELLAYRDDFSTNNSRIRKNGFKPYVKRQNNQRYKGIKC